MKKTTRDDLLTTLSSHFQLFILFSSFPLLIKSKPISHKKYSTYFISFFSENLRRHSRSCQPPQFLSSKDRRSRTDPRILIRTSTIRSRIRRLPDKLPRNRNRNQSVLRRRWSGIRPERSSESNFFGRRRHQPARLVPNHCQRKGRAHQEASHQLARHAKRLRNLGLRRRRSRKLRISSTQWQLLPPRWTR